MSYVICMSRTEASLRAPLAICGKTCNNTGNSAVILHAKLLLRNQSHNSQDMQIDLSKEFSCVDDQIVSERQKKQATEFSKEEAERFLLKQAL